MKSKPKKKTKAETKQQKKKEIRNQFIILVKNYK